MGVLLETAAVGAVWAFCAASGDSPLRWMNNKKASAAGALALRS